MVNRISRPIVNLKSTAAQKIWPTHMVNPAIQNVNRTAKSTQVKKSCSHATSASKHAAINVRNCTASVISCSSRTSSSVSQTTSRTSNTFRIWKSRNRLNSVTNESSIKTRHFKRSPYKMKIINRITTIQTSKERSTNPRKRTRRVNSASNLTTSCIMGTKHFQKTLCK